MVSPESETFDGNRQQTAGALDINRATLYKKMKKYDLLIDEPSWATSVAESRSTRRAR